MKISFFTLRNIFIWLWARVVRDAGLRPHCSHPLGSFCCCVCLAWCVCCCSCAGPRSRPGEGALPRRLRAALWEPCGATRLWLRRAPAPLSLLRAVRWPGRVPGRRLHRRPEPLGVNELTRPVALVPSTSLSTYPHLRPQPDAGAVAPFRVSRVFISDL